MFRLTIVFWMKLPASDGGVAMLRRRMRKSRTPLSVVHRQLLESLEAAGYGEVDNSAIIMAYQ